MANDDLDAGRITDDAMRDLRAMVGLQLRPESFIDRADDGVMRRFVDGIGDLNPLFRDATYAQKSPYGSVIGHPCLPYVRHYPGRTRFGLPGVHGFFAGNEWVWFRPLRPGDRIIPHEKVTGVEEKTSKLSKKLVITRTLTNYRNQRGELLASVEGWSTRHERRASREGSSSGKRGKSEDRNAGRWDYTPEYMERVEASITGEIEEIAGQDTRYFEDVHIGDELPAIVRGPLTDMDITSYVIGVGRTRGAHGVLRQTAARHPKHFFRNPKSGGGLEYTGMGHMTTEVAQQVGAPGKYDYGPQRISWLASLLTNWMSDQGQLVRLRAELRGFNIVGDITWLKGKVTGFEEHDGFGLVHLDVWGENQLDEVTMPGQATVRLPRRSEAGSGFDVAVAYERAKEGGFVW